MSKLIKFFSMILIIFSIFISFYGVVFASDINMNLTANITSETNTTMNESINDVNAVFDDNLVDDTQVTTDVATMASSVSTTVEEGLGFTNILSILLITVGVILILLAIAIIIRLK